MSQPKRYTTNTGYGHEQHDGEFVMWDDYAALAAENERLKAIIVDECYGSDAYRKHENEAKRLTAENERLRKAGDAMARKLHTEGCGVFVQEAWLAAKEGRDAK